MSQVDLVLSILKAGRTITPYDAFHHFQITALHSRIADIRALGYAVKKEMKHANGKRWGCYSLPGQSELAL